MATVTTSGKEEKTIVNPSSHYNLFCPFCDDWGSTDSMIARKRLGQHIVNRHPEEVRFEKGIDPPPMEDL